MGAAGSSKEVKKLLKKMKQGVSCFQISMSFMAALTTYFLLIHTVRFHLSRIILLQPPPLPLITSSSSCTSISSSTPPISNSLSSSSPAAAANVSVGIEMLGRRSGKKGEGGRSGGVVDVSSCDLFDGRWVEDGDQKSSSSTTTTHPLYEPGSCPFVEEAFDCYNNGRPDLNYTRLRWKPNACSLPRLEGRKLLEILRGKRLAFVGDSLNRNMWESLVCILRSSLDLRKNDGGGGRVYEITGKKEFRYNNSYAYRYDEYNCTVEFYRAPFLVQELEAWSSDGARKESLRLDLMDGTSSVYKTADVIIFNTAHWWTHKKTSKGEDFYQEGDHVYQKLSADDAYRKALTTWARWVDEHVDPNRTTAFFRGYSWSHFRGGQWNSGGNCDGETSPIVEERHLAKYPKMVKILESVISGMRTPVLYLNITRMTDYRKEAHPSVYRFSGEKRRRGDNQDCSHWCLPGVPDAWNELMYAMLLKRLA
ncbi:hypothetical protein KSP40_PGU006932 [Platanthera guangdongensis]|uniref:Trichome birefringence-like N-terminal domain-containing protein n=1 Tax=Platanthera guangdongensis TaxID=2320717 RepID=A0ABR2LMV7_9ASPA